METLPKKPPFSLTVRARLLIGFMTLSFPILLLIVLLLPQFNSVISLSREIREENLPQVLDTGIFQLQDVVEHWIQTNDNTDKVRFNRIWNVVNAEKERWENVLKQMGNPKTLHNWEELKKLYGPLYEQQLAIINSPRNPGDIDRLHEALYNTAKIKHKMLNIITGDYSEAGYLGGIYNDMMQKVVKNTNNIHKKLNTLEGSAYLLLIFAIFLTVIVPILTLRALTIPIDNAIHIAEKIAAGERNVEIQIFTKDKLGKLLLSLKTMQDAIKKHEETLRHKEEESRELLERIVSSSKTLGQYSSKVAAGDLKERLLIDKNDILGDLGKDLNLMTDGLASITKKITHVSNDIVTMVGTILTSANEQSEGITSQASAINEISASLEEIDKSSKQTMTKAQALREIAKNTYEQGRLGSTSVTQSIQGIKASEEKMGLIAQTILDLSQHTQQIGDITSVVNTLAQQLKMLALNASIEASKAGEAGKGFAAVATEVRNLAEQSEQSTLQVQKILEDIRRTTEKAVTVTEEGTKTLNSGTQLIEKTGEVIHALGKMINEASISSQHIEVAIRQEAVGIEQIVESMNEINRATATFSSGIKEMMAFIHKLDEIAKHLKEDVNIYKV